MINVLMKRVKGNAVIFEFNELNEFVNVILTNAICHILQLYMHVSSYIFS